MAESHQSPSADTRSPTVVVCDPQPPSAVMAAIQRFGGTALRCQGRGELLDRLRRTGRCHLAVVAIAPAQHAPTDGLEVIRQLKVRGFSVVAYGRATADWPLSERCRSLVTGAVALLDSEAEAFAAQLEEWLTRLAAAAAAQTAEDLQISEAMRTVGVVGQSPSLVEVFRLLLRISPLSDLSTIISGETGTGKELIARACHLLDSKRRNGPFVSINCSAINASVAETELFGHVRGSFTGADRDRKGLIRAAHGGVLFLDEIGELPLAIQSKLLRVLQEHRVRAVGDDVDGPVNVRIVAATNADLRAAVERKAFRADLFHRLNVLWIPVAPLRERRSDIALLIRHFADKHHVVNVQASRAVAPEFIEALISLDLPGNVRQLENIVRWTLIHNRGCPLSLADLPPDVLEQLAGHEGARPAPGFFVQSPPAGLTPGPDRDDSGTAHPRDWNLARSLSSCEKETVWAALRASKGNHSKAARMLGVTPRSVYNMIRRHRISSESTQ